MSLLLTGRHRQPASSSSNTPDGSFQHRRRFEDDSTVSTVRPRGPIAGSQPRTPTPATPAVLMRRLPCRQARHPGAANQKPEANANATERTPRTCDGE